MTHIPIGSNVRIKNLNLLQSSVAKKTYPLKDSPPAPLLFSIASMSPAVSKANSNPQSQVAHKDQSEQQEMDLTGCHVLAIDDDPVGLRALESHLSKKGCVVTTASNGSAGLESVTADMSVALIDLRMPGLSGIDCLNYLNEHHPSIAVIILTASSEVDSAVEAMKQGAFQYIAKPFNPKALLVHVSKAHQSWKITNENSCLKDALSLPQTPTQSVKSKTSFGEELLETVNRVAMLNSTVFIGGESGTGKTTVARMIHQQGNRADAPFVSVNCASLPRDLIESELFGHVKGAFTGAVKDRIGKAEVANGGTLFLDEIGDLPLDLQPKLLTFLQDRVIQRIGSNENRALDVRLIVATHRDLAVMCQERRFRQDLFYRLNVLSIYLRPLRERPETIEQIATSTVKTLCQRESKTEKTLTGQAVAVLKSHHWPGNIRELENVLERAVAFSALNELRAEDLKFDTTSLTAIPKQAPPASQSTPAFALAGKTLHEIERQAILATLEACNGNKARTARMLGISEKSIYNKMRRLDIQYSSKQELKND